MPANYPVFVLAVTLLMLTPGPNMAMIVSNSVAYGVRYGLLTLAGTASAAAIHMVLVGLGLQQALGTVGTVFEWVRWAGVAYLLYLGYQTWRTPATDLLTAGTLPRPTLRIVARAFLVGSTNPKVLLFYGAFFPQFLDPARPLGPQLWILCTTFLAITLAVDGCIAIAAGRARVLLNTHGRLRNRISGGLLMGAGLGLALTRPR